LSLVIDNIAREEQLWKIRKLTFGLFSIDEVAEITVYQ